MRLPRRHSWRRRCSRRRTRPLRWKQEEQRHTREEEEQRHKREEEEQRHTREEEEQRHTREEEEQRHTRKEEEQHAREEVARARRGSTRTKRQHAHEEAACVRRGSTRAKRKRIPQWSGISVRKGGPSWERAHGDGFSCDRHWILLEVQRRRREWR